MGGGGKKSKAPPPPKKPPPPAEDITAEVIAPTLRQEAARRARAGAYVTKGQKLGAQGQVLGASPIELADITKAAGIDMAERDVGKDYFKRSGKGFFGFANQALKLKKLEEAGYKFGYSTKPIGLKSTKATKKITTPSENLYKQYSEQLAQRRASTAEARKDRGMII